MRKIWSLGRLRARVAEEVKKTNADMDEQGQARTDTDKQVRTQKSVFVGERLCPSVFVANAVLSLLNLCCYFIDRQLAVQAKAFENEGGFTERIYRVRSHIRSRL